MKTKIFFLAIIVAVFYSACKKPTPDNTNTVTPTGTIGFHLHTNIGNNEVDSLGEVYTTLDGRMMTLAFAQLFISEIELIKSDGTTYSVSGKKLLKTYDEEEYIVGDVPVGNYKSVRFKVGFNAADNALNPTATADSAILNNDQMWFEKTAQPDGYVFLNVQGTIDTSTTKSGNMISFSYQIGTTANATEVTLPNQNFSVIEKQLQYIHMIIDYGKIFQGVKLNDVNNMTVATPTDNTTANALQIVSNIPSMFRYEE